MNKTADILCIGSVLWDLIGRHDGAMAAGDDRPGRITRLPGGVALNIAMALKRFGLTPALLSAVGRDTEGDALMQACAQRGLLTHLLTRTDLPTDQYMAIEAQGGLIAAIADAHSLEEVGAAILQPLGDTRYTGAVALDGNLTLELLTEIAQSDLFADADLRVAPASPGKAVRLVPFLDAGRGTLYVNLEEAGLLCVQRFGSAIDAAQALLDRGAARAVVTHGAQLACIADTSGTISQRPAAVTVTRITGAGDTFMAAHIAAELQGLDATAALDAALDAAAQYVSGKTTI